MAAPYLDQKGDRREPYEYRVVSRGYVTELFEKASPNRASVQISHAASGTSLSFVLAGNASARSAAGNAAEVVLGPVRAIWTSYEDRLKEDLILSRRVPGDEIRFEFRRHGLNLIPDGSGGYLAHDQRGISRFHIHPPTVEDALGNAGTVSLSLEGDQAVLRLDSDFAARATYPLTVDPTVGYGESSSSTTGWTGSYYPNATFAGEPTLVRQDDSINFWWWDTPAPNVPRDNFSIRWERVITFDGTDKWFHSKRDDAMRVFIDGVKVIDYWGCCGERYDRLAPTAGDHLVTVEFADFSGDATALFEVLQVAPIPADTWQGVYYPSPDLSGPAALLKNDASINNFWWDAPGPNMPRDNFSVRWQRRVTFDGTPQWFHLKRQHQMRVYVDGALVVDRWSCCGETYDVVTPTPGEHVVTVEFAHAGGDAYATFDFAPVPPVPSNGWYGVYYPTLDLSGPAAYLRTDATIANFWWDTPAPNMPRDNFSVRWERRITFDGTPQWFHLKRQHQMRVYIDGVLVVDRWWCCGETYDQVTPSAGEHLVTVEFAHTGGDAYATFDFAPVAPIPSDSWQGVYYPNPDLTGPAALLRNDPSVGFWWWDTPGPNMPRDNFSVRWQRRVTFDGTPQWFHLKRDDKIRVLIDGQEVVSRWGCCGETYDQVTPAAGEHVVTVEFVDLGGDATAVFDFAPVQPIPADTWQGVYYPNTSLTGTAALLRNDPDLNFSWWDTPGPNMPRDNFSVRWQRRVTFDGFPQNFSTSWDDNIRVLIDGQPVVDHWTCCGQATTTVTPTVGEHTLTVEFIEYGGDARAIFSFAPAPPPPPVTATMTIDGEAVPVTIPTPGQTARVTFEAAAGQRISLLGSNASMVSYDHTLLRPDGTQLFGGRQSTGEGFFSDALTLPDAGTYTVLLDPLAANTGAITLQLYGVPQDTTRTVTPGDPAFSVPISVPGQNAQVTFWGSAVQRISLVGFDATIGDYDHKLVTPSGESLRSGRQWNGEGYFYDALFLPEDGIYTISINPLQARTGSITLHLHNVPADITRTLTPGVPMEVTTTVPGQDIRLTFEAAAGRRVSILGTGATVGDYEHVLHRPDASALLTGIKWSGEGFFFDATTLPESGGYAVRINPLRDRTGSITVLLSDVPADVSVAVEPFAAPATVTTTVAGQNGSFTLDGRLGHRIVLVGDNASVGDYDHALIHPNGTTIRSGRAWGGEGFTYELDLTTTGSYTLRIDPVREKTGSVRLAYTIVDTEVPTAGMVALPEISETSPITLSWWGADEISGIARYTLWYRLDDTPAAVLTEIDAPASAVGLHLGNDTQYWFSIQPIDRAGNVGTRSPEVTTRTRLPALDPSLFHILDDDPDLFDSVGGGIPCIPEPDPRGLIYDLLLQHELCGAQRVEVQWRTAPPLRGWVCPGSQAPLISRLLAGFALLSMRSPECTALGRAGVLTASRGGQAEDIRGQTQAARDTISKALAGSPLAAPIMTAVEKVIRTIESALANGNYPRAYAYLRQLQRTAAYAKDLPSMVYRGDGILKMEETVSTGRIPDAAVRLKNASGADVKILLEIKHWPGKLLTNQKSLAKLTEQLRDMTNATEYDGVLVEFVYTVDDTITSVSQVTAALSGSGIDLTRLSIRVVSAVDPIVQVFVPVG